MREANWNIWLPNLSLLIRLHVIRVLGSLPWVIIPKHCLPYNEKSNDSTMITVITIKVMNIILDGCMSLSFSPHPEWMRCCYSTYITVMSFHSALILLLAIVGVILVYWYLVEAVCRSTVSWNSTFWLLFA
jgi:hypothetical protein